MSTVATLLSWPGVPELYVVASVEEHSSRYHGLYLYTNRSHNERVEMLTPTAIGGFYRNVWILYGKEDSTDLGSQILE
jgi:hypothetical protein